MRQRVVCAAVAAALALSGCASGASRTPQAAPAQPAQLRAAFAQARATQRTVVLTGRGQEGPDPLGQTCSVRYAPAAASACLLTRRDERMGLISLPQVSYVAQLGETSADGIGDATAGWRRLDPHDTDLSDFSGVLAQLVGLQSGIPDDVVLTDGVATVTGATADTVQGAPATRYDLDVDGGALYRAMATRAAGDSFREALLDLAHDASRTSARIWIGTRDNLPLRQQIREPAGRYGPGDTETIDYANWGAPVTIAAP